MDNIAEGRVLPLSETRQGLNDWVAFIRPPGSLFTENLGHEASPPQVKVLRRGRSRFRAPGPPLG